MSKEKLEKFPKIIHLPKALQNDLDDMARRTGHKDLKNIIQNKTVADLAKWKLGQHKDGI